MVVPDALSRAVCSIEAAQDDPWYDSLRTTISETPKRYPHFSVREYCAKGNLPNGYSPSWKIVVPTSDRERILSKCHDDATSAHQGFHKTSKRVKLEHYWPRMEKDIRDYVRACEVCKASKPTNMIQRTLMGNQRKTERPWQMIQIDFIGPLTRSTHGFCYILVVVDTFSKFVRICPLRTATAKTTIKFLEEGVFLLFGVPEVIISDNGSQFTSGEFAKFTKEYGVKHWFTASYHPQANSSEAANKVLGTAIRSYIHKNKNHRNWDEHIAKIACAMNSSVHTSTKCSPYLANFGQNMIMSCTPVPILY